MSHANDETVSLDLEVLAETDLALRVTDGDIEVWLPKSELEDWPDVGETEAIEVPEWLAKDRGLV